MCVICATGLVTAAPDHARAASAGADSAGVAATPVPGGKKDRRRPTKPTDNPAEKIGALSPGGSSGAGANPPALADDYDGPMPAKCGAPIPLYYFRSRK